MAQEVNPCGDGWKMSCVYLLHDYERSAIYLDEERDRRGVKYVDLANFSGVSNTTVRNMLKSKHSVQAPSFFAIAHGLGFDVLLGKNESRPPGGQTDVPVETSTGLVTVAMWTGRAYACIICSMQFVNRRDAQHHGRTHMLQRR